MENVPSSLERAARRQPSWWRRAWGQFAPRNVVVVIEAGSAGSGLVDAAVPVSQWREVRSGRGENAMERASRKGGSSARSRGTGEDAKAEAANGNQQRRIEAAAR